MLHHASKKEQQWFRADLQKKHTLKDVMKQAYDNNKKLVFRNDKLFIDGKEYRGWLTYDWDCIISIISIINMFSSYVCIYEEQLYPEKIINLFTS